MSTIVNEGVAAQTLTTAAALGDVGISVIAFSEQQLDDALRTINMTHGMHPNIDNQGQEQQQHNNGKHGHRCEQLIRRHTQIGGPRPPTRLETGIRLFSQVPASKVVDFFIALLRRALSAANSRGVAGAMVTPFRDGFGVEHVLVQSFFVWLEHAERRYQKGLPPTKPTNPMTSAAATATPSNPAKVVRHARSDCDGFRPSQRTPSPPRKGGGCQKQQHRAVAEEQQQKIVQQQTSPEPVEDGQQLLLDMLSDKLRKILHNSEDNDKQRQLQHQYDHQQQQAVQADQQQQGMEQKQPKCTVGDNDLHQSNDGVSIDNSAAAPSAQLPPSLHRVLITQSHRDQIISLLAPLHFSHRTNSNIWKTVVSALELKHVKHLGRFVGIVNDLEQQGHVSFDLLSFGLQHFAEKMSFTSNHLVHALLLGPLWVTIVEQFAANRSEEFRAQTRAALLEAESWKYDEQKWRAAALTYAHRSHEQLPDFKSFCSNVTVLLNELRNEMSDQDNLVDARWAHSLLKTAARKLYTERTWKEEHFNDLVHTVLVQRPTLKAFLLNVLLKDHHDKRAHEKWRNFVSTERYRMSNTFDTVNLCSKDEQPQFLSLPRRCAVYEIGTVHAFRLFERQLDQYFLKKTRRVVIGVDAEWCPYVARNRASLLQLALVHSVYLLDLDALHADKSFQQFIDRLFLNGSVTKLGYQFGDDLAMLRARLPACIGLYRPQGIVCIGQLVDELNRRSILRLPDFPLTTFLLPITAQQEEELKEHTRQIKPQRYIAASPKVDDDTVEDQQRLTSSSIGTVYDPYEAEVELFAGHDAQGRARRASKKKKQCQVPSSDAGAASKSLADQGLAYLCRRVLGKPLDKQEQCSVWDRRPLRSRQIRYAALDAHCLMQIYHRCTEWSEQLGLGDDPIALVPSSSNWQRFYAPLPLFCAFTVPKELLLTTTNATDAKMWGNELDDPEGWTGN